MDAPENLRKQSEKNTVVLRSYTLLTAIIFILFQGVVWSSSTPGLKALGLPGGTIFCCGVLPMACLVLTPMCGFFGSNVKSKCCLITYLTCNICGVIGNLSLIGSFSALLSYFGFFTADCDGVKSYDCLILNSPAMKIFLIGTIFFGIVSIVLEIYGCYLSCKTFNNPYFGHEVFYQGGLPISVGSAVQVPYYGNPTYVQGIMPTGSTPIVSQTTPVTEPGYMPKTINGYTPVAVYSQPSPPAQ